MIKATILIDNQPSINNPCLQSEHGLCVYVETGTLRLLCDAGASGAFIDNAHRLGIDLSGLDMVVVSHGHNDHTGGLPRLCAENCGVPIYAATHIFDRFTSSRHGRERDISAPTVLASNHYDRFTLVDSSQWVSREVALVRCNVATNPMPQGNNFLKSGEALDEFEHEMSLAIVDDDALVIISPCSHRGAINIIESCRQFTGIEKVRAFVGGLHFVDGPQVERETSQFAHDISQGFSDTAIFTGHCTCAVAQNQLLAALPNVSIFSTGQILEL